MPFLPLLIITLSWTATVSSRHIHRAPLHRHARQVDLAPSATASPLTAGDAAIEDIQDIQQGLSDLPGDLLDFVHGAQDRLEEIEDALQGLITSTFSDVPSATPTPSSLSIPLTASTTLSLSAIEPSTSSISYSNILSTSTSRSGISTTTSRSPFVPTYTSSSSLSDNDLTTTATTTRTRTTRVMTTKTTTIVESASASAPSSGFIYPSANSTIHATTGSPYASGGAAITYTVSLPLTQPIRTTLSGVRNSGLATPSTLVTASSRAVV